MILAWMLIQITEIKSTFVQIQKTAFGWKEGTQKWQVKPWTMCHCLKTCSFLDLWKSRNKNKWKSSHLKANLKSCPKNEKFHMSLETLPASNRHPKLSDDQDTQCLCWKMKSISYMVQNTVMSSAVSGNETNSIRWMDGSNWYIASLRNTE